MKLTSFTLALLLSACSVQVKDPNATPSPDPKATSATTPAKGTTPNKGICSYSNDPDKGCLKATIAGTNLSVGDFQYDLGVIAFTRLFDKDLSSSHYVSLKPKQTVAFARSVTVNNFFNNFSVTVEGSHTSYSATHTGLGNLQVNNMFVGTYTIQVSKQFDLKVLDATGTTVGYKCAVIWTQQSVDIAPGEETPLSQSVSQFDLDMFDESCSGSTVTNAYPAAASTDSQTDTNTSTTTDPVPTSTPTPPASTPTPSPTPSGSSNQGSTGSN